MPWPEWIKANALRHKKKLIFLGFITGILQYYDMFNRMNARIKAREPMIRKFQRWLLGIPNLKTLAIQENQPEASVVFLANGDVSYQQKVVAAEAHRRICETFQKIDQKLYFGITFRFLSRVLKNMGVLESKSEAEKKLYDEAGYNRRINRKCCGVNLKEFVKIICSMKPEDEDMEGWVERVIREMKQVEPDQVDWESKYIPLRMELIRMFSSAKGEKKEFISNLLIDNPFMRLRELGGCG